MTFIKPCIRTMLLALIVVCSLVPSVTAQEYTVTLTFYQGLNLEQDEVVNTPEVISVVFCGTATEPFVPALDRELFAFPSEVDLFLPYHPQPEQALWLAAGDGTQVMLLPEIPFEQVTLADLVSGDWQQPDALNVPDGTTIVLRTVAGNLYVLRLTPQPGTTDLPLIDVTYKPLFSIGPTPTPGPTVVPEPGSGLLVLLGLVMLLGWWSRNLWLKKTGRKSTTLSSEESSETLAIPVGRRPAIPVVVKVAGLALLVLLGLMLYQMVIAQDACVLTVTVETVGRGQVIGTEDFVCDEHCSLSYQPGEALNLKAVPAEGSLFVEWRLEGEPVAGIFHLHGDATLTAVFASDGSTPEFSVCDNSYENALDVLSAYQPQVVAAPPEGMSLWFKADAIQLDDLLDGWVQRWPDASEQANHATQSDLARQPRYRSNALNGFPVVEFDGQDDRLIWSNAPGSGEFMLFVAARTDAAAAEARRYLLGPQSLAYNDHTLIGLYTDRLASYRFHHWCNNWGNCTEKVNEQAVYAGPVGAQPVLMAIESQYNELDLWLNGERVHEVWPATLSPSSWRSLGGSQTSRGALAGYFQGEIAEVLLYPTGLSRCDQFQVEQYLRQKYDLPVSHMSSSVTAVSSPTTLGGDVTHDGEQALYTPLFGVTGQDNFQVTLSDACGTEETVTVSVDVSACDDVHTIRATAGAGGRIEPSGGINVGTGASQTFLILPEQTAVIADVLVDGVSVGAVDTYTFEDVRTDHRIEAHFSAVPSDCPYEQIQARARGASEEPWTDAFTFSPGTPFQVGGLDDWGRVAGEISLELDGPEVNSTPMNGGSVTLDTAGEYLLTARCGRLSASALVTSEPVTDHSLQIRLKKDSNHAWTTNLALLAGDGVTLGAFDGEQDLSDVPQNGSANGYELVIEGPHEFRQRYAHGDFWLPASAGDYTLTLRYQQREQQLLLPVRQLSAMPLLEIRRDDDGGQMTLVVRHPFRDTQEALASFDGDAVLPRSLAADYDVMEVYALIPRGTSSGLLTLNLLTREATQQTLDGLALQGIAWYKGYTLIGYRQHEDHTELVSIETQSGTVHDIATLDVTAIRPLSFAVARAQPWYPAHYPGNEQAFLLDQQGTLHQIDVRSGARTSLTIPDGREWVGVDVFSDAMLIGVRRRNDEPELVALDVDSGAIETLAPLPTADINALVVDANRQRVYLRFDDADTTTILTYDLIQRQFL